MPFDPRLLRPAQDRHAGQLASIVREAAGGLAAFGNEGVEFAPHRRPDSEVSATSARHSRVKSSTTARMRERLGVDGAADFTASLTCRLKTDTAKGLAAMAARQNPNEWWTKI